MKASSSIGRAPVSKTGGWGFDSLLACQIRWGLVARGGGWDVTMAEEPGRFDTVREAAGGRFERWRLFLSEVRNELKRVTWPSQKEVYATTVVVILTSIFFGVYLFALDYGLNNLVQWIFKKFGAA